MATWKKSNPSFGECGAGEVLSYLITTSQSFRQFIGVVNVHFKTALDVDQVGAIITGTMPDDKMYLSQIVHGPFDADKLDYMHRDGMFTGLQMHVDLDRLLASISVAEETIDGKSMIRLAGSISGTSPLTQIMFNKMLLFTGIYHHHKVRAVDCMLWAIFDILTKDNIKINGKLLANPVDFLNLTDDTLLNVNACADSRVQAIVQAIRERRLWRRAIVIARRTVPEEMHDEAPESSKKGPFNEYVLHGGNEPEKIKARRAIADKIWRRAGKPCGQHEVWLDILKLPPMNEASRMWIRADGQQRMETLGEFVPIDKWVELYGSHNWRSHVFCPDSARASINAATKKVLYQMFGLECNELADRYARLEE